MKKQPAATDKLVAFSFKAKKLEQVDALEGKARTAKEKEVLIETNSRVKAKTLHRAL